MSSASTWKTPKVLMASYGGGHAAIVAPVAAELRARGVEVDLLGFTTARAYFERVGLSCGSAIALLDDSEEADAPYRTIVRERFNLGYHADITTAEAEAYFTVGFRDLAELFGLDEAILRVERMGRKAFEPIGAFSRYIGRTQPDIVVSTTSPRFELAVLRAAKKMGVTSLSLGDLFLLDEREWILSGDFADHLAVISSTVSEALTKDGLRGTRLHVTGNPAFDPLAGLANSGVRRQQLRSDLNLDGRTVILWPMAGQPGTCSADGRPYALAEEVAAAMEQVCSRDPRFAYIIRPHPNAPLVMPENSPNGILDAGLLTPEEALMVSDVVAVEVSTMGLQAALAGKPVVCVGFAKEAGFPEHGLATAVEDLDQAVDLISRQAYSTPPADWASPPIGEATQRVSNLILELAAPAS